MSAEYPKIVIVASDEPHDYVIQVEVRIDEEGFTVDQSALAGVIQDYLLSIPGVANSSAVEYHVAYSTL